MKKAVFMICPNYEKYYNNKDSINKICQQYSCNNIDVNYLFNEDSNIFNILYSRDMNQYETVILYLIGDTVIYNNKLYYKLYNFNEYNILGTSIDICLFNNDRGKYTYYLENSILSDNNLHKINNTNIVDGSQIYDTSYVI
jgi:hypothetical protein